MSIFQGDQRAKDYRRVAAVEIIFIFSVLTLGDFLNLINLPYKSYFVYGLLFILEGFFLYLLMQLANYLRPSKSMYLYMQLSIIAIFILSVAAIFSSPDITHTLLIALHCILCALECYLIALCLQDIYSHNLSIVERLWGSVAAYLLIALGWASFYEIFNLATADTFGTDLTPGYQSFSESLYYSLCSISGTGSVYTNPSHLIRNLSLVEAVWGVLFLVMLIGRLFSLPSKEK